MSILDHCPGPPSWYLDWDAILSEYEQIRALHSCPQDTVFHAEGDVGLHTQMACQALAESRDFHELPDQERRIVFAAVLLHDVAKPACTKTENGRITSRGHSARGESQARRLLWRQDVSFFEREAICGLVRFHQVPFFLVERNDSQRLAYRVSYSARCDHLALVAWADGYGRRCSDDADQRRILDNVALFREYCAEHACLSQPRRFPSAHSRFLYFMKEGRDPSYRAHDDTRCQVTLMSGLPGSGKDHWVREHGEDLPVVSLDAIRAELKVDPADSQGRVVDLGRERARDYLRKSQSFIWNATNLSQQIRGQLIGLFADYNASVRIVYVEARDAVIRARNSDRLAPVPHRVVDQLIERWTVPSLVEAHELVYCVGDA